MPTIICIDVSLSMEQKAAEESLLDHSLSSLKSFFSNLQTVVPNEFIEIITFSHTPSILVEFTKNTTQLTNSLSEIECQDKTCMKETMELCLKECQQWNVLTSTHIVLITDKIPNALKDSIEGFPYGCSMSLVALTPTTDVNNRAQTFLRSCNLKGKLYPGPVLGKDSVDRIFESIMLDHYSKFEAALWFGHQTTSVAISPSPDVAHLAGITLKPTPKTFPATLRIHGFIPATDLHNPPYVSRHVLLHAGPRSPVKVTSKTPDLRVILNEGLRAKDCVAIVDIGLGWFGVVSSHLPKSERNLKKSNLVFSIIAPNAFSWLGNPNFLGLKRLVSVDKQSNMPYKEEYSNSYDNKSGSGMVWIKSSTLKQNIMKVVRYAKRLPDKGSAMFLKELNKVRRSILFYGFTDMMDVLCQLLEKEKTPENTEILDNCIAQLRDEPDPAKIIK
ncbi:integrator complex subunit 14-like [Bolinopsis microptera]|uniref:integrator complex subunit 14-like n=1 Tax=Bolinopsis microptera TaxID=2820187 RepID=UPI00307A957A